MLYYSGRSPSIFPDSKLHHTDSLRLEATLSVDDLNRATSFPAPAVRRLLEKLPSDLPHHHFGDTDPSGWDILRDQREVCPGRIVQPFRMHWRPKVEAKPLTRCEGQTLERLLADPLMADCHASLRHMLESGTKGDYEQETLGVPGLRMAVLSCRIDVRRDKSPGVTK